MWDPVISTGAVEIRMHGVLDSIDTTGVIEKRKRFADLIFVGMKIICRDLTRTNRQVPRKLSIGK